MLHLLKNVLNELEQKKRKQEEIFKEHILPKLVDVNYDAVEDTKEIPEDDEEDMSGATYLPNTNFER